MGLLTGFAGEELAAGFLTRASVFVSMVSESTVSIPIKRRKKFKILILVIV